eukprot:3933567-Rhodomonas_salina.2
MSTKPSAKSPSRVPAPHRFFAAAAAVAFFSYDSAPVVVVVIVVVAAAAAASFGCCCCCCWRCCCPAVWRCAGLETLLLCSSSSSSSCWSFGSDFRSGAFTTLIATDVAARGIDVPEVEVVIQVSWPARAGAG